MRQLSWLALVLCWFATVTGVAQGSEGVGLRAWDRLRSRQMECPLQHTDVHAQISGFVARVDVVQRFVGPEASGPVEAIYTFPLPEDAAVDRMEMRIGRERIVRGVLKRREEARKTYEAAKSAGKTAALLDQERPNVFTQSVANLMPRERVEVRLSYVVTLKYREGSGEFTFPMVVAPRYSTTPDGTKVSTSNTLSPTRPAHDIALTVYLDAGLPIQDIRSALHPVRVQSLSAQKARIMLATNSGQLSNKDFVLRYKVAGAELLEGVLTHADKKSQGGEFLLILQPPAAPTRDSVTPKELIFVVDQTGSQSGEPLEKSKETMRYCLNQLNPSDTFQVLGFNTSLYPCFDKPQPATPKNLIEALRFINGLEANGGTDILGAVEYALRQPDDPEGRLRIVSYMTDGLVDNENQILATIAKERGRVRLFPFGIGNSVNRFLLEGMAREGRGACQIVPLTANGQKVAAEFAHRIADPLLTDISVDWGGLSVDKNAVYPRHIPDVFSAEPILLKGHYTKAGSGTITIRGKLRGKPWERTLTLTLPERTPDSDHSEITTLWARAKLEDLRQQHYVAELEGKSQEPLKEAMTLLALEHQLMSEFTSFVAIEERVVNTNQAGRTKTVAVPTYRPEGMDISATMASGFSSTGTPEPASGVLFALGTLGFWVARRRRALH